jgi:uncharacterized peroxidase-related enzyme
LQVKGSDEDQQEELISALASDHRTAQLSSMDRVMLDYVVKLTKTPSDVARQDAEGLRAVGFHDRAIHDICAITAYYAFVNRIADGLGVELEQP